MNDHRTHTITLTVNGTEVERTIPSRMLLSEFLRESLGYTGVHRGCETAKCGACTVMVDGQPVKSCNMFAVQTDGATVTTTEGLLDGDELHPVQESFWDVHGMQCGYCTPGFVMTSTALLEENDDPSIPEIRDALAGNLCRCTGYTKIVESVRDASERIREGPQ